LRLDEGQEWLDLEKANPRGLKPAPFYASFMYGLKPVPFTLTHFMRFR
jgi:hypothetical protein